MFSTINTRHLSLRRLNISDAQAMFEYRSNPEVSKYQNWQPSSAAEVADFIEGLAEIGPDSPGKWFQIGIALQETNELIGDCAIHVSDSDPRQTEVAISLAPAFHHRGLATEAFKALLGFIFADLKKHRVYGSVDPRNHSSMALMNRVGMRKEAHFVENYWFRGTWVDDVIFAMLKREWDELDEHANTEGQTT